LLDSIENVNKLEKQRKKQKPGSDKDDCHCHFENLPRRLPI